MLVERVQGQSTERVTSVTASLATWRPPCGPMSFAPMAASSRIDRGYHSLSKSISFWPFFRLTLPWNVPKKNLDGWRRRIRDIYQTAYLYPGLIPIIKTWQLYQAHHHRFNHFLSDLSGYTSMRRNFNISHFFVTMTSLLNQRQIWAHLKTHRSVEQWPNNL